MQEVLGMISGVFLTAIGIHFHRKTKNAMRFADQVRRVNQDYRDARQHW